MHRRSSLQATSPVHYTKTQSSVPEDGRNYSPKHFGLIVVTNKLLLLYLVGCLYCYTSTRQPPNINVPRTVLQPFTKPIPFQVSSLPKKKTSVLTFYWPCIAVYLSQYLTNLMHKVCFTITFISCLYMFRAHVLIIRRSKLHYTSSGIITPIGGRLVYGTATYRCDDTKGSVIQFWPPDDDEHMCSKHVEAWNKNLLWNKFSASSWLNTEINETFTCRVTSPPPQKKKVMLTERCLWESLP